MVSAKFESLVLLPFDQADELIDGDLAFGVLSLQRKRVWIFQLEKDLAGELLQCLQQGLVLYFVK